MQFSILVLMVLAMMVPLLIFVESKGLAIFGISFFFGIFYLVDSFSNYVVSSAPKRMQEAEDSEKETEDNEIIAAAIEGNEEAKAEVDSSLFTLHSSLIDRWIEKGGHLQVGLKLPHAAEAIGIPQYQLSTWLKHQGLTYASWMTDLRIDEAKRMLKKHPEWSNETIALHCGFSDRTYFQKKFKEKTGLSPAEYIA
jgi:AraC-like DNA-binding protein